MAYSPNNPWVSLINDRYPFAGNMADSWERHHANDVELAPLTSSLVNQRGNTAQAANAALQSSFFNKFSLPMELARIKLDLAGSRNRVNQNFGPNRARRAFYSGI